MGPSTYIETPKKIWGKKVNVKFFTVDPYFGCMFFLGPAKSDKNSTFCHFSTYMGGLLGPAVLDTPGFSIVFDNFTEI